MSRHVLLTLAILLLASLACGEAEMQGGNAGVGEVGSGEQVFERLGCPACHSGERPAAAPALEEVYGTVVRLEDGGTVTADDAYLRESILSPSARIVSGYGPIMPSYEGLVSEQDLEALIDYLRRLDG
jgi:cytochrome c oxidase subunit 2